MNQILFYSHFEMALIYVKFDFETMLRIDIPTFNMFVRVFMEKNFSIECHSVFIYNYEADFCWVGNAYKLQTVQECEHLVCIL